MELKSFIYEKKDKVATVILNRPERANSFGGTFQEEVVKIWEDIRIDKSIWVAVVSGAGKRFFSSGMDVKEAAERGGPAATKTGGIYSPKLSAWHNQVWKPVITAVNGICAGGGFHFVVDSDLVIASDNAEFIEPHVSIGQVAALEPIALARRIPLEAVFRLAFLGSTYRMSAQRAYELGLVGEVVPYDRLMPRAYELAEMIKQNSPSSVSGTKKAIWGSLETGLTQGCRQGWEHLIGHWNTRDFKEGPKAFAEKRKPEWGYD